MYLYGASGHAKVIIDILKANNISILGIYDDNSQIRTLLDYPVEKSQNIKSPLIISIGNNSIRKKLADSLMVDYGVAIHPSSIISSYSQIGQGTVIMQGAIIQSSVTIGKHAIINTGASVDHDCLIGDYVHISPGTVLCGNVSIGEGAWIGAGTTIIPGVTIGAWSVIGAGSVVTKDIPSHVLAAGNRCRVIKQINQQL